MEELARGEQRGENCRSLKAEEKKHGPESETKGNERELKCRRGSTKRGGKGEDSLQEVKRFRKGDGLSRRQGAHVNAGVIREEIGPERK